MFSGTVKKRNSSIFLTVCFCGLVFYLLFSWFNLQGKIKEQTQSIAIVNELIKSQEYENTELKRIVNSGKESEYIEHIARKDLGYAMPGERVYYDISAGE